MSMTEFQILFRDTMYKITDDLMDINAEYLFARTDEIRLEIINGINTGTIKNLDDVDRITKKQSPVYKAGLLD